MFSLEQIKEIVARCKFRDWDIRVEDEYRRPYLQLHWKAPNNDNIHGPIEAQVSRKWWLSYHMCENEIVRTAYMAVRAAVEHEMNEQFTFDDARIFDPHFDYTQLASLIRFGKLEPNNRDG